jgi:hypothetical protein
VLLAGARTREVARGQLALLGADADARGAREHVVELVADRVPMARLLLSRLQAVGVAEEVRRVDEADLPELLGREREREATSMKASMRAL